MADNRQFADHVELGGANVYFKEEPTTGTTMPSTSYFKTEDVDGKPVKISRDNIMGIVKECLGTILNGGSDQTTVTKVPTLNGNTLGASAVSTLASVLGGLYPNGQAPNNNLNNITSTGIYSSSPTTVNKPTNINTSYTRIIAIVLGGVVQLQIAVPIASSTIIAYRIKYEDGSWAGWYKITAEQLPTS